MKNLTLLVLAAGMGSRFGGLKQIEPVGPNGEFIIDYSIYDAIKAGFNKVVFVIKEENYTAFKETIGKRLEEKIKVEYVFQDIHDVPASVKIPEERVKPLGTAHAVYAARDVIQENFAIINADDFYGRDGYLKASAFLNSNEDDEYANIAYEVGNTLTENGEVKRGVIFTEGDYLENIIESSVKELHGKALAKPLSGEKEFMVPLNQAVSMNLFCFTPKIFTYLENHIAEFFTETKDILKDEWLIPSVAYLSAKENKKKIKVIKTDSKYLGMTYKEDLAKLKSGIEEEIQKGIYKSNLWS